MTVIRVVGDADAATYRKTFSKNICVAPIGTGTGLEGRS
jgi:hypothetical protein